MARTRTPAPNSTPSKSRSPSPIPPLSDQLRAAIDRSGLSAYDLAQQSGIHRSNLSRFLSGNSSLSLDSIDRLAGVLRLKLLESGRRRS